MSYAIAEGLSPMPSAGDGIRRITVIDDNQEFVDVLAEALEGQFLVAGCAEPSLAAIRATGPDLLLFDPWTDEHDKDGLAFIDRVRNDEALGRTPIIVSSAGPLGEAGGLGRLGSETDVYLLSKPFALEDLERVVGLAASKRERYESTRRNGGSWRATARESAPDWRGEREHPS